MRQWMVAAKKADFYAIAEKFHVDPVVARIIRNREVIGEKNIRIYLGGNLSDLSDPHQMKDMDRLVEILAQKIRKQVHIRIIGDYEMCIRDRFTPDDIKVTDYVTGPQIKNIPVAI